jgi:hypothetical protein
LKVPIIINGIHDPYAAAKALADGYGDIVALARPLLADPEYVNKVREGRINEIVKCNRSNYCMRRMVLQMPVRCDENPITGRENRCPGRIPPLNRILAGPIEKVILGLTGSPFIMNTLGTLAGLNKKKLANP